MNVKKTLAYPAIVGMLAFSVAACGEDSDIADQASDAANQATSAAGDAAASATGGSSESEGAEGGNADGEMTEGENADGEMTEGDMGGGEMAELEGPNGPVEVPQTVADKYEELGGTSGYLGAPTGETQAVGEGQRQDFDGGTIFVDPEGNAHVVQGKILERYDEQGGPESDLGWPTADEKPQEGGWISTFQNGNITFVNGEYGE